ncbi:unnamed protein product, partial [Rotaria socialis]
NQTILEYSPLMEQQSFEQDKQSINRENSSEDPTSSIVKTSPPVHNPTVESVKKSTSGFLIISPSSSSRASSSTSTSSAKT